VIVIRLTGDDATVSSTVMHRVDPGTTLTWSDSYSHAGGVSAAALTYDADGAPRHVFMVYCSDEPASDAEQAEWRALYARKSEGLAGNFAKPGRQKVDGKWTDVETALAPGTAHRVLHYDFALGGLVGGSPSFVGITLSNTMTGFDDHNAPCMFADSDGYTAKPSC